LCIHMASNHHWMTSCTREAARAIGQSRHNQHHHSPCKHH
jgi:hypothetical protein